MRWTNRYLHTQLPYAYVHLITLLVNLNNVIVSVKCGLIFGKARAENDIQEMINQSAMVLLVPILYHGLLSISYVTRAALQPTQKLKANLATPTVRRFLIHYFEL